MKSTSLNTETDNLVLFPSAKNFPLETLQETMEDDPIEDLMNEFSELRDCDIPQHLDDRFEEGLESELEDDSVFGSLEAFMGRHQNNDELTPDDRLVKLINERLSAISEAKERIKFYLNEIEMFLPKRR